MAQTNVGSPPRAAGAATVRRRHRARVPRLNRAALAKIGPFIALAALALALRLAVIPPGMVVDVAPAIGDEGNYYGIAHAIAAGEPIPDRWPWIRPPGYPLVLAALLRLGGGDLRLPLFLQAVLGTGTVLVTALLAGRLWGRRAAILAGGWAALDPSLTYYTRLRYTETIYTFLFAFLALALALWAGERATGRPLSRPLAAAALLAGLAAAVRPAILSAVPLLALWIAWRGWREGAGAAVRRAVLFVGLFLLVIAPVTAHNWYRYERFILLDTTLSYTFWRDHRDGALPDLNRRLQAIPNPGDRQGFALRQGLAWVRAHPAETLTRSAGAVRGLWGTPLYVDDAIVKRRGPSDLWRNTIHLLAGLNWLVLVPLALAGAWRARRAGPLVPLGLLAVVAPTIGVALSHPEPRFVMPSLPLLIAVAAGVAAAPKAIVRSRRRGIGAAASIGLFLLLFATTSGPALAGRVDLAWRWGAARLAERAGRPAEAARGYATLLERDEGLSEPLVRLAILARARGDDAEASAYLARALERDGDNYRARALQAQVLRDRGREDETRRLLAQSGATAPDGLAWAWEHQEATPPPRLVLDGTDSGFARGFFAPERGGGGRPFRWMGARAWLRLAPASGAAPRALTLTLESPRPAAAGAVEVTVLVNGREAGRVVVRPEPGWEEVRVALPAGADPARPLTVELRAGTIRLANDARALGVAVASVALDTAP